MSDYWKKKLDELNGNTSKSSNQGTSTSKSNYWQKKLEELEEENKKKKATTSEDIAPVRTTGGGSFSVRSTLDSLSTVVNNDDFVTNSGYKSTSNGRQSLAEKWFGVKASTLEDYDDLTYEYINNQATVTNAFGGNKRDIRSALISQYRAFSADNPYSDSKSIYEENNYDLMTKDEVAIYNYLYNTEGKKKADEYLNLLIETLNTRKATSQYENIKGSTARKIISGVDAGIEQAKSGVNNYINMLTREDDFIPYTSSQILSGMVREDLADEGFTVLGNSLGQIAYDLTNNASNMSPSMMLSAYISAFSPTAGKAAGSGLMGIQATGNAYQEALREGYSKEDASAYAKTVGASEAGLQYLIGGIGKLGGTSQYLSSTINSIENGVLRFIAKHGAEVISEASEEALQEILNPIFKNAKLGTDEDVNWSDVAYSALLGGLMGATMGGGGDETTLTKNEQAVIDKVYNDAIKEAEKDGKLSKAEKSKIYNNVLEQMDKGYISTDTIEEVLGGETYKTYKDTTDSENALIKEYEELGGLVESQMTAAQKKRFNELDQIIADNKKADNVGQIRSKLSDEVSGLVKGSRLFESYNQKALRGQAFAADLTKYDTKQQETVKRAIDSGILNNTRRTHELVDMVSKISADKGVLFDFTNNAKLKESGFAIDGKQVNGFVKDGTVTLNTQSAKYINSVVGHEVTHILEGTDLYTELQNTVFEYAKSKGEYQTRYDALAEMYKNIEGADVNAELTADLVGDYLFMDNDFINNLSTKNRNVFQKIYDEIKYLCKVATAGSKEARELEKVKKAFEQAYKESGKANTDTKYSMSDSTGKQLSKEQQDYFRDSKMRDDNGNLMVMYHGSQDAGFHTFDANMSDDDTSFFFVDRNDVAASYSGTSETYEAQSIRTAEDMNKFIESIGVEGYEVVEKDGKFTLLYENERVADSNTAKGIYEEFCWYEGVGDGDVNYKVYLNLKNPLEVDAKGRPWNKIDAEFSQEVYNKYQSLTAEEKAALVDLAEWEDFSLFNSEIQEATDNELASAYKKMGEDCNIYDLFSVAADNFSEDAMRENARKYLKTRDYAQRAKEQGYDGVIFKNIVDNGGYSNGSEGASTVAIAFDSNQIKSVANDKPTADPDIRYSLSNTGDTQKKYGNYAVSGKDIALEVAPEAVGQPVAKDNISVDEVAPIPETVPKTEGNAPVVDELFPDDLYSDDAEMYKLIQEKAELEDKMIKAVNDGDYDTFNSLNNEWVKLNEHIKAVESDVYAEDASRINSLNDADAPPEMEAPYYEKSEPTKLTKKATDDIVRNVRANLSLSNNQIAEARSIIERYRTGEIASREQLIGELQDSFGRYTETEHNEEIAEVQAHLRNTKVNVPDYVKLGIPDYAKVMRSNFGKIRFSKEGAGIDQVYEELSGIYPHIFPSSIDVPEQQLERMIDVANEEVTTATERTKDIENIEEAADIIISGINDFKLNQELSISEKNAKAAFADLVKNADHYAPLDDYAPVAEENTVTESEAPVAPVVETVNPATAEVKTSKGGEVKGQQALYKEAITKESDKVAEVLPSTPKAEQKKNILAKFRSAFLDKQSAIEDLSLKKKNRGLMGKADFMLRSASRAQRFIKKNLLPIVEAVEKTGNRTEFETYAYHLLNMDRMTLEERFKDTPNKSVFGDSVTADVSRKIVSEYEAKHPGARKIADAAIEYNNLLRKMLVDGNVISQETSDLLGEMYPHYLPIRRAGKDGAAVSVPLDSRKTGVNSPIKKATGGNSSMESLLDTMASRTEQVFRAVARNNFGLELMHTIDPDTNSQNASYDEIMDSFENKYDELLKKGENGGNPTFTVFENGKRVTFEITEELYDALKPAADWTKADIPPLKFATDLQRGLLTQYNVMFMAKNVIKDSQAVLINSQHPAKTYANYPVAIKELAQAITGKEGKWITEYLDNGGEDLTYFDSKKQVFKKDASIFKKVLGFVPEKISQGNDFFEKIPRLAEYIASRKNGASVEVAMLDAARVTTNFAAGGDVTKWANRNGATFLNASVQGFNQQVRNIREAKANGLKGVMQLAAKYAIAGLPVMLLNHILWDDDEDYEQLSDYVKDNYYIVAKYGDGKFVRIPKGREVAVIQNAFEQMKNLVTGDDEVDMVRFGELLVENIAPNNPMDNNVIAPLKQAFTNKTWYGDDLVPTRLQDLPAEEQYDETTDAISKWLGETTGLSPYKINYVLDQYSGGIGDVILPYLTLESDGGGLGAGFTDIFTTDSVLKNQNVSDFYEKVDELTVNANSSQATDDDVLKSKYMNSINSELSKLYQKKREIQNSDLSDEDKSTQVRAVQQQIVDLIKEGMTSYENIQYEGDGEYAIIGGNYYQWYTPEEGDPYWRKLTGSQVTKYNLTKNAGDAHYVTDGNVHYRLDDNGEWTKISDKQLERQKEVTEALGITPDEYWCKTDISFLPMSDGEYEYAFDHPENYAVAKAVGGYDSYKTYSSELYNIKADKDENGKSISGSRKDKVIDYINNLDADYGEKIILFKSEYPADDTYNGEIIDYLNSRQDITYEEMVTILKELGFTISSDGKTVSWD